MPVIDMPLAELKKYQGISPCPEDFNGYWQKALEEMHSMDPKVEMIPSTFKCPFADCYDLYFTGVRGARIHAKFIKPKNIKGKHPAVLKFHGYTWYSGDWSENLKFAAAGFFVAAMDCRGQGGLSEDVGGTKGNTVHGHIIRGLDNPPEDLLFRHMFLDTAQLASIIMGMPEVDENRVGVTGGSQGGALTIACASLEPRIKLAAPVYPFLCDYRRVWEMDLAKDAYLEISEYFRKYDPLHKRENETFQKLGYIDIQYLAERIRADVLFSTGLMDNICPPSTQFAVYNKIKSNKQMLIYPDYGHEELIGNSDEIYMFLMGL